MAACVVVISNTNQLLYLRTAECPDPLFYHFKAHSALDVIEDKLSKRTTSGSPDQLEQYLGLLYPMEDHRIYGYVTNTKVKFIMIFESHTLPSSQSTQSSLPSHHTHMRDADIRGMFQRLHSAYIDLVCSPFYKSGTPIQPDKLPAARRFDQRISTLLATHASSGYCSTFTSLIDETKTPTGEGVATCIISPKA